MDRPLKSKMNYSLPNQLDCLSNPPFPKFSVATDEDLAKIKLPWWRYAQIDEEVIKLYETTDVRSMPLPVFDIAKKLNIKCIQYHQLDSKILSILESVSEDAFTIVLTTSEKAYILYNQNVIIERIKFSIMHEIGHLRLKHKEHSLLAEIEANYFAVRSLCPVEILEHLKINSKEEITKMFGVSEEFAKNRLKDLESRKRMFLSETAIRTRNKIIDRFI